MLKFHKIGINLNTRIRLIDSGMKMKFLTANRTHPDCHVAIYERGCPYFLFRLQNTENLA